MVFIVLTDEPLGCKVWPRGLGYSLPDVVFGFSSDMNRIREANNASQYK